MNRTAGVGDPYWYEWSVGQEFVLTMLDPDAGIAWVTLQADGGKGLDDVVVAYLNGDRRCIQVKHTRDGATLTFGDLVSTGTSGESLLATMAKEDNTDPVRRGKFVLERLLCRNIAPPSPEIVAMFKPLDLSKTARDQFTQHRASAACASCHNQLDPLGLPAEHYDAVGQWRDTDRGMPIDATKGAHQIVKDEFEAFATELFERIDK